MTEIWRDTDHTHLWYLNITSTTSTQFWVFCSLCGVRGMAEISTREPTSELEKAQLQEMKDIYRRRFGREKPSEQEVEIAKRIVDHGKNYRPGFLERIEDWMDKYWPWRH